MTRYFHNETVPFHCLISNNPWDIHAFQPLNQPILQSVSSIKTIGILHPPLVKKIETDRYEVITGSRCLSVFQTVSSQDSIECRILSKDLHNSEILTVLFHEYTAICPLSPIALAYFYKLCAKLLNEIEQQQLLDNLNLNSKPHFINRILALLKLNPAQQLAIKDGLLSENMARELLKFPNDDRDSIFQLFSSLNVGTGKQKRMLMLIRDIAGRQGMAIKDFLKTEDIQQIIDHQEMNIPQKAQSLLQLLQGKHSPSLNAAEAQFQSWKSQIEIPDSCSLNHSQSFENDSVTMDIRFKNKAEFETFWAALGPKIIAVKV